MNIIEKPFDPTEIFKTLGRKRVAEEEKPSPDHAAAFEDGYEFKILRSPTARFGSSAFLEKILGEERGNGWELVEKLDNSRIWLARMRPESRFTSVNGVDPYRAVVGTAILTTLAIFSAVLSILAAAFTYFFSSWNR